MHILIVEDDAKVAEFVSEGFRREGHAVTLARDGEEGLAAARNGDYAAAVMDIMLPKMDGLEIIRRLRAVGSKLPVIILSARGSVEAKIEGLEAGADDYLAKPFSIAELVARVQALLRRANNAAETSLLRIADLEMDLVTHRVRRGGRSIDLQPLEYKLLEYLLRNAGRVVTKTVILERVWDYDFAPRTNVVETRVGRLRDKIDKGFERKLIRTVRGFGYVIEKDA